jgi:HD superfamily phosphohydrolase
MATIGLSHPRALTPVDDPIHKKYEFSLIDRALIDSTYFQRLHFVLQNSTNYISFPANKNTRFPHSMGVAHIAGRMFNRGLSQASGEDLADFLTQASHFLVRLSDKLYPRDNLPLDEDQPDLKFKIYRKGHAASISGFSGFLHTPLHPGTRRIDTEDCFGPDKHFTAAFIVDTFWQALRLYGLMHDIGHLPMSHAFEVALKRVPDVMPLFGAEDQVENFRGHYSDRKKEFAGLDEFKKREKFMELFAGLLEVSPEMIKKEVFEKDFHEIRGISIYNRFLSSRQSRVVPPGAAWQDAEAIQRYAQLVYYLSVSIILSGKPDSASAAHGANAFLYSVKRIVDGEVDADRLDYTLRDCSEAGSQLGDFDLEQVISNSLLVRDPASSKFSFGTYFQGVSGVEQFYEQRYSSYKYVIHHRTASRSNTCLEYLISLLFIAAFKHPDASCAKKLAHYGLITLADSGIKNVLPDADDIIERIDDAALRTMLFDLRKDFPVLPAETEDLRDSLEQQIAICLDVVLLRRLEHVETAFKNERMEDVLRRALGRVPADLKSFATVIFKNPVDFWLDLRHELTQFEFHGKIHPVGLLVEAIVPKVFKETEEERKFEETVWVKKRSGALVRLRHESASLRLGVERQLEERQMRVYIVSKDIKITKDLLKAVEQRVERFLAEKWNQLTSHDLEGLS